jgi:hypothetical protein
MLDSPAPAGGARIELMSADSGVATVDEAVVVAAGAKSATFTLRTAPESTATGVEITASYVGSARTVTLRLLPPVASARLRYLEWIHGPLPR